MKFPVELLAVAHLAHAPRRFGDGSELHAQRRDSANDDICVTSWP
jgi:hypothetical protein